MSAPSVYAAIIAVAAELSSHGIAKAHVNEADGYKYRSIDDLLARLAPLLAKHRLCILPQAIERDACERSDGEGGRLFHVTVRVAFVLTSGEDGSSHSVVAYGEALDESDKATAKAMSAAYKSAMIQTFCIPVCGEENSEKTSPQARLKEHEPEPLSGWPQWCADLEDIIGLCESEQAVETLRDRNRRLLTSLSRERPKLYEELGGAFLTRLAALRTNSTKKRRGVRAQGSGSRTHQKESAHA